MANRALLVNMVRRQAHSMSKEVEPSNPPTVVFPNPQWKEHLEGVRHMRQGKDADVDEFGCGPLGKRNAKEAKQMRFQVRTIMFRIRRFTLFVASISSKHTSCSPV